MARQSAAAEATLRAMGRNRMPRVTGDSRKSAILSRSATSSPIPSASAAAAAAAAAPDEEVGDPAPLSVGMETLAPTGVSLAATSRRV